jgi:hypothetical protein
MDFSRAGVAVLVRRSSRRETISTAVPDFENIETWTERLSRTSLRTFTTKDGHFWLEQNSAKASKWAKLARQGHQIAWEFDSSGGAYTGRLLIDGQVYSVSEATRQFFRK